MKKLTVLMLLTLFVAPALHAEERVVDKAGRGIQKGANATARGIEKGGNATARGIEKGGKATVKGVEKGVAATGRGLNKAGDWIQRQVGN